MAIIHDTHSHAREADIPGTVNLRPLAGDEETYYGQALFPVPSADPNDPLQWPSWKKHMILFCCSAFSFLANSALIGPSTYIGLFSAQFGVTPNTAAGLVNYPNLAFGFSNILFIPAYQSIGRRPVMLIALIMYVVGLAWAAKASSFASLMGARIVHSFGGGVCEALPVQLVNDIFFLHERGKKLGWYTIALCVGSTGPLFSGLMLGAGLSWNLFFWVEFAFGMALLVLCFLFVEETRYERQLLPSSPSSTSRVGQEVAEKDNAKAEEANTTTHQIELNSPTIIPPRKPFLHQLHLWSPSSSSVKSQPLHTLLLRSFSHLLVPSTFWVITTYGIFIGLAGFAFAFIFPLKIVSPPYSWPSTSSGFHSFATFLGFGLAIPFVSLSDRLAAYLTKKNNGIREAEMRLPILLPAMLIAPAGIVVFGMAAEKNLHWVAYMAGVAITQFGAYFYFTVTLAYAVDSYTANLSEMLIIMNVGKQAISFGMALNVLDWILESGYGKVISGVFGAVLLGNNLVVLVFMAFGKRIRRMVGRSWLAKVHARTVVEGEGH
ncbi:major facilitator superfamily domain-containing protein [Sordaria brevicollis]|uniref:Major facilitator superfamily domain-containing protein n=1 Tax=Sordaria brevicollis TaxID=83679 RepID=A0AAE0NW77_SORBR|nr:major facilitator superfamily domain-containing protein [Sordaria brevicollis]